MRPRAPWALQGPLDDTSASSPLLLWVLGFCFVLFLGYERGLDLKVSLSVL